MPKSHPRLAATALATLLCAPLALDAQTTTFTAPSGYTKQTLATGFNFVGLTLHNSVAASGTIDGVTVDTTLTDSTADFTTSLGASGSALYLLRVLDGTLNGTVAEIASWTATDLTTAGVTADFNGRQYEIRKAVTIDELFGDLLSSGSQTGSDILWIPQPDGSYNRYYIHKEFLGSPEWRIINPDESTDTVTGSVFINYLDAFFVQIIDTPKEWTLFGDVLTTRVVKDLPTGFNLTSAIFPVGNDLVSLGLENFMASGSQTGADILWSYNAASSEWDRYYVHKEFLGSPEWRVIDNDTEDASTVPDPAAVKLGSAVFIQRIGVPTNGELLAPTEYSTE